MIDNDEIFRNYKSDMDLSSEEITNFVLSARETARADRFSKSYYVDTENNRSNVFLERHIVVFGRRGSGKTTLLAELEKDPDPKYAVIWVDADEYKNLTFPDTLIQIFRALTKGVIYSLRNKYPWWDWFRWRRAKKQQQALDCFLQEFSSLLERFDEADVSISDESTYGRDKSVGIAINKTAKAHLTDSVKSEKRQLRATSGLERKTELIDRRMQDFKEVLRNAVNESGTTFFLVLDDFYHLRVADQAPVLDYLGTLFKNTNCYLKFSSISHRTCLYKSGSIIQGLQLGHDVHDINLDRSFKNFDDVDRFLVDFRKHLCRKAGTKGDVGSIFTEGGWRQIVLASGGVPRDFTNVLIKAIEIARRKPDAGKLDKRLINEAANLIYRETKREDLRQDIEENADLLERLLKDISDFCVDQKKKNVFLISTADFESHADLEEAIKQLCDFRFIHEIHENTSRAGTPGRFRAYLLDVGIYAYPERRGDNQVDEIAFWKKDERHRLDALRSAPIYRFREDYSQLPGDVFDIGKNAPCSEDVSTAASESKGAPKTSEPLNKPQTELFDKQP